jgi:glycosyltransferase involved in cell wall biosynthesis
MSTMLNPLVWITFRATDLILLKTQDNLKYIPQTFHKKCRVSLEVGLPDELLNQPESTEKKDGGFKILFVSRLEYWKGLHLAIRAFAHLLERNPNATFTVIGSGPDEAWFKKIAAQSGVLHKMEWIQRVPQKSLFALYKDFDILLFPSFHDSSGNVIIEALAHGLPVVCLDLGGPKELIDETCGIIIPTGKHTEQAVVDNITGAINTLADHPELLLNMRKNALKRAKPFSVGQVVANTYNLIHKHINRHQLTS